MKTIIPITVLAIELIAFIIYHQYMTNKCDREKMQIRDEVIGEFIETMSAEAEAVWARQALTNKSYDRN